MPYTTESLSHAQIMNEADQLQAKISTLKIEIGSKPTLALSCHNEQVRLMPKVDLNEHEFHRRMTAVAEVFRLSTAIYVFRTVHEPLTPLSEDLRTTLDEAFRLLAMVPDAVGPGGTLSWCLIVLGAEIDAQDRRDYIQNRIRGICALGINSPASATRVLEQVWAQRDSRDPSLQRWQEVMQNLGQGQVLV